VKKEYLNYHEMYLSITKGDDYRVHEMMKHLTPDVRTSVLKDGGINKSAMQFLQERKNIARFARGAYSSMKIGGLRDSLQDRGYRVQMIDLWDYSNGLLVGVKKDKFLQAHKKSLKMKERYCADCVFIFRGSAGFSIFDWFFCNFCCCPTGSINVSESLHLKQLHFGFKSRAMRLKESIVKIMDKFLHEISEQSRINSGGRMELNEKESSYLNKIEEVLKTFSDRSTTDSKPFDFIANEERSQSLGQLEEPIDYFEADDADSDSDFEDENMDDMGTDTRQEEEKLEEKEDEGKSYDEILEGIKTGFEKLASTKISMGYYRRSNTVLGKLVEFLKKCFKHFSYLGGKEAVQKSRSKIVSLCNSMKKTFEEQGHQLLLDKFLLEQCCGNFLDIMGPIPTPSKEFVEETFNSAFLGAIPSAKFRSKTIIDCLKAELELFPPVTVSDVTTIYRNVGKKINVLMYEFGGIHKKIMNINRVMKRGALGIRMTFVGHSQGSALAMILGMIINEQYGEENPDYFLYRSTQIHSLAFPGISKDPKFLSSTTVRNQTTIIVEDPIPVAGRRHGYHLDEKAVNLFKAPEPLQSVTTCSLNPLRLLCLGSITPHYSTSYNDIVQEVSNVPDFHAYTRRIALYSASMVEWKSKTYYYSTYDN
jgi:hypothetical protein